MRPSSTALSLLPLMLLAGPSVSAEPNARPADSVLNLTASAEREVPQDQIVIVLVSEQDGSDPANISASLSRKTNDVLEQARKIKALETRSGGFGLNPSYDRNSKISGWHGRSELVVTSTDFAAASKFAGQVAGQMQVASISFGLSRAARDAAETALIEETTTAFQNKANATAKALGFRGFSIREVSLNQGYQPTPYARPMIMARAMVAEAAVPVPAEGGKTTVSVQMSGNVLLTR